MKANFTLFIHQNRKNLNGNILDKINSNEFSPYFEQILKSFCTKMQAINNTKVFHLRHIFNIFIKKVYRNHGTMIRTGITCRKIPCYMRDSACRWCIVVNAKIF